MATTLCSVGRLAGEAHARAVRSFVAAADVVFLSAAGLMVLALLLALRLRLWLRPAAVGPAGPAGPGGSAGERPGGGRKDEAALAA
ncbi:hypothetical protein [Kitasatospora sp. NPDC050543]|uniref:hypothetical protein n=1 Tax=Kitasatospora sp. NPDC050543 TaxID=3364054 RepID=UPI00378D2433